MNLPGGIVPTAAWFPEPYPADSAHKAARRREPPPMTTIALRNVAIIAHVDHGKTTMVDELLRQSGQFRPGELEGDCILDSDPLERERGITILSKNCAIQYRDRRGEDYRVNILDTPGHADFGGEVERVLTMADGALLLVDAFEGPMPQTRYVLSKALHLGLRPIVVVNKMDRPEARPDAVIDEVFDLLVELDAEDEALDFPIVYASGKSGWASRDRDREASDVHDLFDAIIEHVPPPRADPGKPLQLRISTLDYNDYVGRIGIGRVHAGVVRAGQSVVSLERDGVKKTQRIGKVLQFEGLGRREVEQVSAGDLVAIVGLDKVEIGLTIADPEHPVALPPLEVDEPTLHMTFRVNDGPFAGQDGEFVTSRQLRTRLERELQRNVAMRMTAADGDAFDVFGRGMLHLGILLENMRREGYELAVGKPQVVEREVDGRMMEPIERLVVDAPNDQVGAVLQLIGERRGEMLHLDQRIATTHLVFEIPARGLIGLRGRLLTATAGEAIMHHVFERWDSVQTRPPRRPNGVMIATESGPVTAYALEGLHDRGVMFVTPGDTCYEGQIVGEHNRENDIVVNVCRGKKLTNIRSSTKEATVTLKAPRQMSLEAALEYLEDDERVEITPRHVRLRKRMLREADRRRVARREASAAAGAGG